MKQWPFPSHCFFPIPRSHSLPLLPVCSSRVLPWHEEGRAGEAKIVQIKMEKKGLVDMENSGKSLAIPCTSRGTLEKLYPVGIQVFIDAAASPVPSRSVHGAPGPSLQLLPPGFLHQQRREHLRRTLGEVHKVGKLLMLIKNLLRFKCLLFLPSKNLSLQPPHLKS